MATKKLLGDKVKSLIETIVPQSLLDMLGEDCGCDERRQKLNHLDTTFTLKTKRAQLAVNELYYKLFNEKVGVSFCGPCVKRRIDRIKTRLYELERQK